VRRAGEVDKRRRGGGRGRRGEEDLIFIPEVQKYRAEWIFCCQDVGSQAFTLF